MEKKQHIFFFGGGGFICIISSECAYPNEIMVIRPEITDDFLF